MTRRNIAPAIGLVALVTGALLWQPTFGQGNSAESAEDAQWVLPRTPWGSPDLQGIWSSGYILTPLERPDEFEGREFVTEEEKAALEAAVLDRVDASAGGTRQGGPSDDVGTYNSAFSGFGREVIGSGRTSQIIDPPDGKIPWIPEVRERHASEMLTVFTERGRFLNEDNERGGDGPEDRPNDRCLGVSIPLRFAAASSSATLHRIVQSPDHVSIYYEHGHLGGAYRHIPLDGRPHLPAASASTLGTPADAGRGTRSWSIPRTSRTRRTTRGLGRTCTSPSASPRDGPGQLIYQVTVEDASVFTGPWTIEIPMTQLDGEGNQIYESACHEGNYAMTSILMGARLLEAQR